MCDSEAAPDVEALRAELARLREEAAWIRRKLGLAEDTPTKSGRGPTVYGAMHVVCSHAHGYETYIKTYRCEDKDGEIARLTVERNELKESLAAITDVAATANARLGRLYAIVRDTPRQWWGMLERFGLVAPATELRRELPTEWPTDPAVRGMWLERAIEARPCDGTGEDVWLVLSLYWSQSSDDLTWYAPRARGYVQNVLHAGRYARSEAIGHESEDRTLAVPLSAVMSLAMNRWTVEAGSRNVELLRKSRADALAKDGAL